MGIPTGFLEAKIAMATEAVGEVIPNLDYASVMQPIAGNAGGKNLLSMRQLDHGDIHGYISEAYAIERVIQDPRQRGVSLLPFVVLKAVMRQPSTRTAGSMVTAINKLGGTADLISGMTSSSEAKGESLADSWIAFATQADIIGTRTAEDNGPMYAARVIAEAASQDQLWQNVPVINLGDGRNEHPTQALGDLFTVHKEFDKLEDLKIVIVGDHERYRAHHSLMIGAATVGMSVVAVESKAAPVPHEYVDLLGDKLTITPDLDAAMSDADILYIGRNPDEYTGEEKTEKRRSKKLAKDYESWVVDLDRIQQMSPDAIVLHPRPRRNELHPSVDSDPRMRDVQQMENMIPMRMAIIAKHLGKSISGSLN